MLPPMTITSGFRRLTSEAHMAPMASQARASSVGASPVALVGGARQQRGVDRRAGGGELGQAAKSRRRSSSARASRARAVPEAIASTWPMRPQPQMRTVELDHDVADLAGRAVRPDQRAPVDDDAAADAGRDGDVDRGPRAACGPVPPLGQDGDVGVALHEGRQVERLGHARAQRHVAPAGEVRGRTARRPATGRAGRATEIPTPTGLGKARRACVGTDLGGHLADPGDDRVDPLLVARGHGTSFMHREVGGDQRRADLGATEVDRQDRPIGELVHVAPILARRRASDKRRAGSRRASRW